LPQTKLEFLPHSSELEYTEEMLDSIVSSSGKISAVTVDHDRNQVPHSQHPIFLRNLRNYA
jgi:hypothetical protein